MDKKRLDATLRALEYIGFDLLFLQETKKEEVPKEQQIDKRDLLDSLYRRLAQEKKCILYEGANGYVFGEGNPYSPVVFVGEAPGEEEDQLKRPFVGRAGRYLNQKLQEVGLRREEVYITNVVKSRPPGNRKPTPKEMQTCLPYLRKEIEIISPRLIVCLGATALEGILGKSIPITKHRGQFLEYPYDRKIKVLLTYHPAYILRNPGAEKEFVEDLRKVREFLGGS